MPKGYSIRKPEPLAIQLKFVDLPDGADLLTSLTAASATFAPKPAIIFSALGALSPAHLRVPRDDTLDALLREDDFFGVEVRSAEDLSIDIAGKRLADRSDPTDHLPPFDFLRPQPHWYDDVVFTGPLLLVAAFGGQARPESRPNFHLEVCGDAARGADTVFVAQLRAGTRVCGGACFVMGVGVPSDARRNVNMLALSVDVGEEVVRTLRRFLESAKGARLGKAFVLSAVGQVSSARFRCREVEHELEEEKPFLIDGMTGLFGGDMEAPVLHASFSLPAADPESRGLDSKCDSVGGELVEAWVGGDMGLDIVIGEILPEGQYIDIFEDEASRD